MPTFVKFFVTNLGLKNKLFKKLGSKWSVITNFNKFQDWKVIFFSSSKPYLSARNENSAGICVHIKFRKVVNQVKHLCTRRASNRSCRVDRKSFFKQVMSG